MSDYRSSLLNMHISFMLIIEVHESSIRKRLKKYCLLVRLPQKNLWKFLHSHVRNWSYQKWLVQLIAAKKLIFNLNQFLTRMQKVLRNCTWPNLGFSMAQKQTITTSEEHVLNEKTKQKYCLPKIIVKYTHTSICCGDINHCLRCIISSVGHL